VATSALLNFPLPSHDADRMHRIDPQLTELILEYVTERLSLAETPIDGLGNRETMVQAMAGLIDENPKDPQAVLDVYIDHLADTVLSADSPRFYAFIPAAPTKASLLFDMVVSAASLQGCSWLEAAGAVMAENQALRVMADAAGMGRDAGGTFVSGGSAGNLSALVVARDSARNRRSVAGIPEARLRVVVSDQAHSSISNALNIVGMDVLIVPTVDGRMDEAAINSALSLENDLSDVVAIVATAGTTNAGIIDDLDAASRCAADHGWWFHVDAAYGGAGMLVPELRQRYTGVENVDSIVMDPHKWWFAPFDSAALIYKDPHLAKSVHTQDASYLDVIHGNESELNPSDLAYHLTRRARGMALWFSLAVNGIAAYRDAVAHSINLAAYAADQIEEIPHFELIRRPDLSVVLFRRIGWTAQDYQAWSDDLLRSQVAFVTSSGWQGETVGRLVFLHPSTTTKMVDEVLATMR
jgi:aromatic-L-amino-acid/L-tryptophan decarboxylase